MEDRRLLFKRCVGFLSIVAGILLFYFVTPIAVSSGLLATWISIWPIVVIMGLGGFFFFYLEIRRSLKMLMISLAIWIPWSLIFFIPLPNDLQGLLAVFIAGVGVLLYRQYYRRHESGKQEEA